MEKISTIELEKTINLFLELVKIDSESGQEKALREHIKNIFDNAGIGCVVDAYGNLVAYLPGDGEPLALTAHMDTVRPGQGIVPIIENGLIKTNGETILGADDKSGVASIVSLALMLKEKNIKHRALELIFTREEEIGLLGAQNLDYSLVKSRECLVLDHGARPGKIAMGSPYLSDMEIKITGKSAHASKPEHGINAIAIAAKALSKIKIGRIDKFSTVNVGVINGGLVSNSVPEMVEIKAEVRSHKKNKHDEILADIKNTFEQVVGSYGAALEFRVNAKVVGFEVDKKSKLYKDVKKTFTKLGMVTWGELNGGASDANIFNQKGISAIQLGSGGEHSHTTRETIYVAEIEDLVNFVWNFVKK